MNYDPNVFGYVNGQPVYSRDEFIFKKRKFGPIETDEKLIEYAQKVTHNWLEAGWHQSFIGYYLSTYALAEPYKSLTKKEFDRLCELQEEAIQHHKFVEGLKEWKLIETVSYADNSEEEIWENKFGERKTVMTVQPHGDAC